MNTILIDTTIILSIILAVLSVLIFSKLNKTQKVFAGYLILSAVFELIAYFSTEPKVFEFLIDQGVKNNLPGLHLFTLCQFLVLGYFFHLLLKIINVEVPIKLILGIGILLIIGNSVFLQSIWVYNSYSKTLVEAFIVICSLLYFFKVLNLEKEDIKNRPNHFFVMAVFIAAALSSLFYLFSNEIMRMDIDLIENIYSIKTIILILSQGAIFYGLYLSVQNYSNLEQN